MKLYRDMTADERVAADHRRVHQLKIYKEDTEERMQHWDQLSAELRAEHRREREHF